MEFTMPEEAKTEAEKPAKKTTRKKAVSKKRYFAFAEPHSKISIAGGYAGNIENVDVNGWSVVAELDPAVDKDAVIIEALDVAANRFGGRSRPNPRVKEVASNVSKDKMELIGNNKIDFNRQAYRKTFEGLERV
jgi:hypothetical protein